MTTLEELSKAVIDGDYEKSQFLVKDLIAQKVGLQEILNEGLIHGMNYVGEQFKQGEFFVPEVMMSARAMQTGLNIIEPLMSRTDGDYKGTVIIGTVQGDVHDIGKNLVTMMLKGGGYKVYDLGTDIKPERFVSEVREKKPDILAMSCLLTTTMKYMKTTVEEIKKAGLRDNVKIVVGGAPITQAYASQIGADGYSKDAASAVDVVKGLVKHQ